MSVAIYTAVCMFIVGFAFGWFVLNPITRRLQRPLRRRPTLRRYDPKRVIVSMKGIELRGFDDPAVWTMASVATTPKDGV